MSNKEKVMEVERYKAEVRVGDIEFDTERDVAVERFLTVRQMWVIENGVVSESKVSISDSAGQEILTLRSFEAEKLADALHSLSKAR